jgi:hypothetical protein
LSSCIACLRSVVAAGTLIAAGTAFGGPPYFTDDPAPTDYGHWEIYQFAGGSHVAGSTAGEAGFDFNYGAARDVQVTFVLPAAYETSDEFHAGLGVIETAVKYRFAHQSDAGWRPDVAFFPRIYWPTASSRFASTRASVLLPLWVGKDVGPWSVFGGGGYQVNPGDGNRDFWLSGLAVTRAIGERWSVGGEIYHRTADATGGKPLTAVNVGLEWALSKHWSLLASLGPGVQNASQEMDYGFYVGLKSDY